MLTCGPSPASFFSNIKGEIFDPDRRDERLVGESKRSRSCYRYFDILRLRARDSRFFERTDVLKSGFGSCNI